MAFLSINMQTDLELNIQSEKKNKKQDPHCDITMLYLTSKTRYDCQIQCVITKDFQQPLIEHSRTY